MWLHVDGAYGLPAAAHRRPAAPLFAGLERADSVTLDAHKWLGRAEELQPSCSCATAARCRRPSATRRPTCCTAATPHNAVDRTLEYSRPFRSLKLWLAFRIHGARGVPRLDRAQHAPRPPARRGRSTPTPPSSSCTGRSSLDGLLPPPSRAAWPTSTPTTAALAQAIQADGRVYLAPAAVDGRVCLRVCFVNFRTTDEQVDDVVGVIRELGGQIRK